MTRAPSGEKSAGRQVHPHHLILFRLPDLRGLFSLPFCSLTLLLMYALFRFDKRTRLRATGCKGTSATFESEHICCSMHINGGLWMVHPTPRGIALMEAWAAVSRIGHVGDHMGGHMGGQSIATKTRDAIYLLRTFMGSMYLLRTYMGSMYLLRTPRLASSGFWICCARPIHR